MGDRRQSTCCVVVASRSLLIDANSDSKARAAVLYCDIPAAEDAAQSENREQSHPLYPEGDANMQDRRQFLQTGFSLTAAGLAGAAALTGARQADDLGAAPALESSLALRRLTSATLISCVTRVKPTRALRARRRFGHRVR